MKSERDNLEFGIVWCETNLRYLAGEPQNEETKRQIEINKLAIEEKTTKLQKIQENNA